MYPKITDSINRRAGPHTLLPRCVTHAVAKCVQVLLSGLFDALDGAEYVPDRDRYLQVLEVGGGRFTGCDKGDCSPLVAFAGPLSCKTTWPDSLNG